MDSQGLRLDCFQNFCRQLLVQYFATEGRLHRNIIPHSAQGTSYSFRFNKRNLSPHLYPQVCVFWKRLMIKISLQIRHFLSSLSSPLSRLAAAWQLIPQYLTRWEFCDSKSFPHFGQLNFLKGRSAISFDAFSPKNFLPFFERCQAWILSLFSVMWRRKCSA